MTTVAQISDKGIDWLHRRKIDPETALRYGVFTASRESASGVFVPDGRGTTIAFPFMENGVQVACKYRGPDKRFEQDRDGRRTFWNSDVLDDPALADKRAHKALIITEGEIDALTAIDCGHSFTVSVPDGAPSIPKDRQPEELDPIDLDAERHGKFAFVFNNRERLDRVKTFILATDDDAPGRRLRAELLRRLGAARCMFITYPPDPVVPSEHGKRPCKDLNEVRVYHGADTVNFVLAGARPFPLNGLYRLFDYPDEPDPEMYAVGWDGWAPYLRVYAGEFMVVTGIPSHGKTAWTLELCEHLCVMHNWRVAMCSPEMRVIRDIRKTLRKMKLGYPPGDSTLPQYLARADEWINNNFYFIDADGPSIEASGEIFDVDWIIAKAIEAVARYGIKVLLIDPWNEIEHARRNGETTADYIGRAIRSLKSFARRYDVMVIVVAHPTKEVNNSKDGKLRTPRLYDIDGAAHWYNKCDHGIVVERPTWNGAEVNIYIAKVRLQGDAGTRAKMTMEFHKQSARYTALECGLSL